jgi:hypothetical protein
MTTKPPARPPWWPDQGLCPTDTLTPWGMPDSLVDACPGVWFVSTSSHGGYYVDDSVLDRIPEAFRKATFCRDPNFYEQDCDWAIIALFFPEAFPAGAQPVARDMLASVHPDLYARHQGGLL